MPRKTLDFTLENQKFKQESLTRNFKQDLNKNPICALKLPILCGKTEKYFFRIFVSIYIIPNKNTVTYVKNVPRFNVF